MDYIFLKLGVNSSSIENPIVMTETLCNPNYSRKCKLNIYLFIIHILLIFFLMLIINFEMLIS